MPNLTIGPMRRLQRVTVKMEELAFMNNKNHDQALKDAHNLRATVVRYRADCARLTGAMREAGYKTPFMEQLDRVVVLYDRALRSLDRLITE